MHYQQSLLSKRKNSVNEKLIITIESISFRQKQITSAQKNFREITEGNNFSSLTLMFCKTFFQKKITEKINYLQFNWKYSYDMVLVADGEFWGLRGSLPQFSYLRVKNIIRATEDEHKLKSEVLLHKQKQYMKNASTKQIGDYCAQSGELKIVIAWLNRFYQKSSLKLKKVLEEEKFSSPWVILHLPQQRRMVSPLHFRALKCVSLTQISTCTQWSRHIM